MEKQFILLMELNLVKLTFVILFSIFLSVSSYSQDDQKDVIYPVSGNDSILDCQIIKIKGWNTIIFEKDDIQDTVLAIAALKNGRFIDFRTRKEIKNNAYPLIFSNTDESKAKQGVEYYQLQYQKALKQRKGGAVLSLVGAFAGITSYVILATNDKKNKPNSRFTPIIFIGSGAIFNLGAPLWISGSIKAKKNEKAISKQQRKNISANLGVTNNGFGLIIGF